MRQDDDGSLSRRRNPGLDCVGRVGGQMATFCGEDLSAALKQNGLSYDVYDFSREHYEHLQLKHRVARELKEAFAAESNTFIWENQMAESIESTAPYDPATCSTSRYLYHVKKVGRSSYRRAIFRLTNRS
jgi:hypothetical protein